MTEVAGDVKMNRDAEVGFRQLSKVSRKVGSSASAKVKISSHLLWLADDGLSPEMW